MSELPAEDCPQPRDPAEIHRLLPEREREQFLTEYRTALDAAHEVWRYRQLQDVLGRWSLIATATSKPGYHAALEEARAGAGAYTSLDDVLARRRAGR